MTATDRLLTALREWQAMLAAPGSPTVATITVADYPCWTGERFTLTEQQMDRLASLLATDAAVVTAHRAATGPDTP